MTDKPHPSAPRATAIDAFYRDRQSPPPKNTTTFVGETPPEPSPGTTAALVEINRRLRILEQEGWRTSGPWPQDRPILLLEAGSTGVFRASWDAGLYWAEDGDDLWPVRSPLAWREVPSGTSPTAKHRKEVTS